MCRFISPKSQIPDLTAIFDSLCKNDEANFKKQDNKHILKIKYSMGDKKFIDPAILDKLKFDDIEEQDLFTTLTKGKDPTLNNPTHAKMDKDSNIDVDTPMLFKTIFNATNAERKSVSQLIDLILCLLSKYPGAFKLLKVINSLARG